MNVKTPEQWIQDGWKGDSPYKPRPQFVFWAQAIKRDKRYKCWEWPGIKDPAGYGRFRRKYAHRYAWETTRGPIPPGMCICHHCDNPSCVRPDHLFMATQLENIADRNRKGRTWNGRKRKVNRR